MAAKSRERLTKWSRGHYLLNVFETSVAIIFTESSSGFLYTLTGILRTVRQMRTLSVLKVRVPRIVFNKTQ